MADPMRGKYTQKRAFLKEFETAKERLASLGGTVTAGVHDYEAFIYEAPGIRLIFYPHTTSARNQHIRVRASGKCDQAKVRAAIFALAENSCTFQFPADVRLRSEAVAALHTRKPKERSNG